MPVVDHWYLPFDSAAGSMDVATPNALLLISAVDPDLILSILLSSFSENRKIQVGKSLSFCASAEASGKQGGEKTKDTWYCSSIQIEEEKKYVNGPWPDFM